MAADWQRDPQRVARMEARKTPFTKAQVRRSRVELAISVALLAISLITVTPLLAVLAGTVAILQIVWWSPTQRRQVFGRT